MAEGEALLHNCLLFTRVLRRAGVPVGLDQAQDFVRALAWVDIGSREQVYHTARCLLVRRHEHLRIFGTRGFVECVDGGMKTRLVVGEKDHGPLDTSGPAPDYFDRYLDALSGGPPMPLSPEDEVHPTRMTIRARQSARTQG